MKACLTINLYLGQRDECRCLLFAAYLRLPMSRQRGPRAAPQRCKHALISLACCHAEHSMSTRMRGIKPLRCASFTAVKQSSWPCTWPPPPQIRCTRLITCPPSAPLALCHRALNSLMTLAVLSVGVVCAEITSESRAAILTASTPPIHLHVFCDLTRASR